MKRIISSVKVRMVELGLFFRGDLSFSQTLWLLIPGPLRSKKRMNARLFGKPFIIPNGEIGAFVSLFQEIVTANQYHVELIHNGCVIDAGANMGIFSIFAAHAHPDTKIFAFEPTPQVFDALKENTKHYPNITAFNCGLGEREKVASFIISNEGVGDTNHIGHGGILIDVKTIDNFALPVGFIKIDTEGYEANILEGASETIKKYKPVIAMSAYHKPNDEIELPTLLNSIAPYDCELRYDCEKDFICRPR